MGWALEDSPQTPPPSPLRILMNQTPPPPPQARNNSKGPPLLQARLCHDSSLQPFNPKPY